MFDSYPEFFWRFDTDDEKIAEFYVGKNRYKIIFKRQQVWDETEDSATPNHEASYWEVRYGAARLDGTIDHLPEHDTDSMKVFGALFYILYDFTKKYPNIKTIKYHMSGKQDRLINRYIQRRMPSHFPNFNLIVEQYTRTFVRK